MNIVYCHIPERENVMADGLTCFPVAQLDPAEPFEYYRGIVIYVRSNREEELPSYRTGVLGRIGVTYLVGDEDKTRGEDARWMTREEKEVRSYRAEVLGHVEEAYSMDGKTCREEENMVAKLIIEKDDISLLAKWKNLIGRSWYGGLVIWKLFGKIAKSDGSH